MNPDRMLDLIRGAADDAVGPILLLRHAARESLSEASMAAAMAAPLTEEGRAQARALGARLRGGRLVRLCHSPVARCAETAQLIAEAAGGTARVEGSRERLGAPYLRDAQAAIQRFAAHGLSGFVRAWVQGRVPEEIAEPHAEAARALLEDLLAERDVAPDVLHLHVTHDLTMIALLGLAFPVGRSEFPWPGYLESCAVTGAKRLELHYRDEARALGRSPDGK